jgi:hypothetical protein
MKPNAETLARERRKKLRYWKIARNMPSMVQAACRCAAKEDVCAVISILSFPDMQNVVNLDMASNCMARVRSTTADCDPCC